MAMRGLTMFIADIRQCTTKEMEQRRIDKELGNIRAKFAQSKIDGYQLKKYVWKIIYMMMLGFDIDFGHMESVMLISSAKYSEKNVGYVACTLMLTEQNDILRLIIQSIKNDLNSKDENVQCLALTCIANVGGEEFAESLAGDVQRLLVSGASRNFVKKKAALCLLRLFRKSPDVFQTESWAPRIIDLLSNSNIGVVLSVMTLLIGLSSQEPEAYSGAIQKCVELLSKLHARDIEKGYIYYTLGCPWLQVKILKFLQYQPAPTNPTLYSRLLSEMSHLIGECSKDVSPGSKTSKNVNKSNAGHAVLFEAVNLIIHYNLNGSHDLLGQSIELLGHCISISDTNLRSLSLETMSRLSKIPGTLASIKKHQSIIIELLTDSDIYLKKRALDMLFNLCDTSNSTAIVQELVASLQSAEYAIREEMVLKIAILAENFATDDRWYIDVIIQLIQFAGDFVSSDIWHRVIQVVTNNDALQAYAAQAVYNAMSKPKSHETLVKLAGYILGEFGHLIESETSSKSQFEMLHSRFENVSISTQCLLLSTYMKMWNLYPQLKSTVLKVFQTFDTVIDDEMQQRAVEYTGMVNFDNPELMNAVWEMMPPFPERASSLLQLMRSTEDRAPRKSRNKDDEDVDEDEESEEETDTSRSPSPNAASSRGGGSESKDSDDEEYSDTSPEVSPKQQAPIPDLFSIEDLLGNGPVAPIPSQPRACQPQNPDTVQKLLLADKGVLYESAVMQIGVMLQVDGSSQCKMILYIGNKSTSSALSNVQLTVNATKFFRTQLRPDTALEVAPKAQLPLYILWQVMQPFPPMPAGTLSYVQDGVPYSLNLLLPMSVSKFMVASNPSLGSAAFIQSWQQPNMAETHLVLQSVDPSSSVDSLKAKLTTGLRFDNIVGVDQNPYAICAISVFHHLGMNGTQASAPVCLRIELQPASPGMLRVTTRTTHPIINAAIEATLKCVL